MPSIASTALAATPIAAAPTNADQAAAIAAAARLLLPDLERGRRIDAAMLRAVMERAFDGSDAEGSWDWKTAYDACEAATVLFLRKFGPAMCAKAASPARMLPMLAKIGRLFPTHTRRSQESQALQQFSTPIMLGLAASTAAAVTPADLVLEPSAGTGLLAIFAELANGALVLNELADVGAGLLDLLFPGIPVSRFDAAQIDDHLGAGGRPSVVLMNPPFSAMVHVEHRMTTERDDTSYEPPHTASPTEHALAELQLYGYRPFQDEPDPRPLPEARLVEGAVADISDALVVALTDTRLEPDLEELLWAAVNLFHRATGRIERELDDNEQAQKRSQRDQDGSEIRSVELERLTAEGKTLIERRNCMEFFRDQAADQFERHTSSAWRPRLGSMVNHRTLTSAMIDSRDFLAAKRRAETEVLVPAGPKIAVTGGLDLNDHRLIWDRLDRVHAKHPDMVLLHGGSPKGAERIAARWADHRKVPQIAFKPDWTRHAKAAPFKRNDAMLDVMPIGVMVFPGTGIQDNLADKAKKLGIPVGRFGGRAT